jgi:cyclic-di-AMP phosphodiesterase PgpH
MSLVFAALLTLVQRSDALIKEWTPKAGERAPVTLRVPYSPIIVKTSRTGIAYGHARIVVPRGTLLDEQNDTHRVAIAFETARREGAQARLAAVFGVYFTLFYLAATYLRRFGNARTRLLRMQLGLFAAMTLLVLAAKALLLFTALPELWIPLATVPMWVALSYDRRTAFVINVLLAFMASSILLFDLPLLTVFITRGLASSIFFRNKKHPWQMVPAGLAAGVVACGLYAAIRTMFEGTYSALEDVMDPFSSPLLGCVGGGGLAGLLGAMLRRPGERLLGAVSRDRLIELTDLDQELLQKMANEAPGSWEHARAMANLAEAAAAAINADSLLVRVGAYYHDLGKTVQPKYFVENLLPGEKSPHDDLDPDVSADAIMAHVVQGAKILREGGVPEPVVEFAYTHHGTQTIEYFWHRCLERGNPKNLREDFFRYPGMKPQTKETAILMLVDSIEAASRTIQPPDRQKFEEMIQRVVFTKLRSGQLDESGLTLEDLRTITTRMSDTLVNMYHGRIKYPWQREGSRESIKVQVRKPN